MAERVFFCFELWEQYSGGDSAMQQTRQLSKTFFQVQSFNVQKFKKLKSLVDHQIATFCIVNHQSRSFTSKQDTNQADISWFLKYDLGRAVSSHCCLEIRSKNAKRDKNKDIST